MAQKSTLLKRLQASSVRLALVRYVVLGLFILNTLADRAWNLIPTETAMNRWLALGIIGVLNSVIWFLSRKSGKSEFFYRGLLYGQIILDIIFVSLLVFSQRGIASRGVALYALPIIEAVVLVRRGVLYVTAGLCTGAYTAAVMYYQFLHPSEGYKIELYGALLFYSAMFFVAAILLQLVTRPQKT